MNIRAAALRMASIRHGDRVRRKADGAVGRVDARGQGFDIAFEIPQGCAHTKDNTWCGRCQRVKPGQAHYDLNEQAEFENDYEPAPKT